MDITSSSQASIPGDSSSIHCVGFDDAHERVKSNINEPMLSVVILLLVLGTTERGSARYRIIFAIITFPYASIDTLLIY